MALWVIMANISLQITKKDDFEWFQHREMTRVHEGWKHHCAPLLKYHAAVHEYVQLLFEYSVNEYPENMQSKENTQQKAELTRSTHLKGDNSEYRRKTNTLIRNQIARDTAQQPSICLASVRSCIQFSVPNNNDNHNKLINLILQCANNLNRHFSRENPQIAKSVWKMFHISNHQEMQVRSHPGPVRTAVCIHGHSHMEDNGGVP